MENKKKKIKLFIILGITLLAIVLGGTYAYYRWTTSDDEVINIVAEVGAATVTFDGGSDISATLQPVSDKGMGIVKNITVVGDTDDLVFNMYLDIVNIDEGLNDESFQYALYSGNTLKSEGDFSTEYLNDNLISCTTNNTNHLVLLEDEDVSTTRTEYTLYIWIDGANYTNPNSMMNKDFTFKLHADGTRAILKPTAIQRIKNDIELTADWFEDQMTKALNGEETEEVYDLWIERMGDEFPTCLSSDDEDIRGCFEDDGDNNSQDDLYTIGGDIFNTIGLGTRGINFNSYHTMAFVNESTDKICVTFKLMRNYNDYYGESPLDEEDNYLGFITDDGYPIFFKSSGCNN